MPTVTFVQATYVHFSNISAVTEPNLTKKMLAQNIFQNKSFCDKQNFQTQKAYFFQWGQLEQKKIPHVWGP